jgi:hypothetical protein
VAELKEAAKEAERGVRGRRGRKQAGYRLGEGREWFERDLGLRVYAAMVEKLRVQGVQELGLIAGQRRGRGVRVRLRRRGWHTVAEATWKEEAVGGGEMAYGLGLRTRAMAQRAGEFFLFWTFFNKYLRNESDNFFFKFDLFELCQSVHRDLRRGHVNSLGMTHFHVNIGCHVNPIDPTITFGIKNESRHFE